MRSTRGRCSRATTIDASPLLFSGLPSPAAPTLLHAGRCTTGVGAAAARVRAGMSRSIKGSRHRALGRGWCILAARGTSHRAAIDAGWWAWCRSRRGAGSFQSEKKGGLLSAQNANRWCGEGLAQAMSQ
ncbi:hypothetical protein B0H19DRAFT_1371330 [Mycena capillaripes]|nr:hypothetical protein B0H19DRAFT_1371330 [Mycena capillaripes]